MPFRGFFKKEKSTAMSDKERQAKLGLKVVMAQQNPEPVYDLSDCAMVELPPDTFVMCKLLQKTTLLLRNNGLTSLEKGGKSHELEGLEVLDLTNNKLSHLPESIDKLKNLRILKLGENKLKNMPSAVSELSKLQELHLSSNKFSKVPVSVCALPKLRVLSLAGNNISELPKDFCNLQKSLRMLEIDADKLKSPPTAVVEGGVEATMRHLCEEHGVPYEGPDASSGDTEEGVEPGASARVQPPVYDEALLSYLNRKEEKLRAQMAVEEEFQARERMQLAHMLKDMSVNKQHLLEGLFETPVEAMDHERRKLAAMQEQYNIEESLRAEQAEQLEKYLASSSNKESLIQDLSVRQADLDQEVEGLVTAKERERQSLLRDLTGAERDAAAVVRELVDAAASRRSGEFLPLLEDQERKMRALLSGVAEEAAELHRTEVIAAMKSVLVEEAAAEQRRLAVQEEQGARIGALLEDADLVNSHLEGVLTARLADQEEWTSTLMQDEECQAAAFELLLLKCDLKRNNILRQIGQIEFELARLSSLEVRKKKHGVKYGSTTMLEQRVTLAGLLKSLLMEKNEREAQLTTWLAQLRDARSSDVAEEEFWLVQYQRLLSMKPAGLAEAEDQLEPRVRAVLKAANALDLTPVFAHNSMTFSRLMDLSEEEASTMGIGPATYKSLQCALQNHLASAKLGGQEPSAPSEEDSPLAPSAPELAGGDGLPSAPVLVEEGEASAPPLEGQFVEAECVVCLSNGCQVVFLPCGHVCACATCCASLVICPMCRSPIISKILLNY